MSSVSVAATDFYTIKTLKHYQTTAFDDIYKRMNGNLDRVIYVDAVGQACVVSKDFHNAVFPVKAYKLKEVEPK